MQYLGPPYVYKFEILMDNISIISPNSAITINNITYWMGDGKFYQYSGRVETLPCSLRQYIFNDINKDQAYQIFAGGNEGYNEVWWFYCSTGSNVVDKYVIYNYLDKVWYYGTMGRTAWLDSGIRQYPMGADYNKRILYHEANVDDVSGLTPEPISAHIQSSDFDIGDGHNFGFIWRILPDINFNGSNVNQPYVTMTVKPRQNSGTPYGVANNPAVRSADNYSVTSSYNIQEFDGQVYTRLRGRQMAFRIESNSLGVSWQLGTPRIDIRNDGRR
jgi:protein involved in ribonucleotide reduction